MTAVRAALAYASVEKRDKLVQAALELMHERGFHRTTLADVAGRARVPLGNVHYYFKAKEALAQAVISTHESSLQSRFAGWCKASDDPIFRLRKLILDPLTSADSVIRFGCPHGGLCQELQKLNAGEPLAKAARRLLNVYLHWAEEQFAGLGHGKRDARELAQQLIASVQGVMLIAHTLRSVDVLKRQLRRLVDSLQQKEAAGSARQQARTSR